MTEYCEIELRCEKCGRYLGDAKVETGIIRLRCPGSRCKHVTRISILNGNKLERFKDVAA